MKTMTNSCQQRAFYATAVLAILASGYTTAIAAAGMETRSSVVKYGDLNLSNTQGATTLYRRIVAAAHEVCSYSNTDRNFLVSGNVNKCIHKAIADAVTKVGRPELIAIYNANNREPLPMTLASAGAR